MYKKTAQFKEQSGGPVFIIVPDRNTLEAEKSAFRFLNTEGLMDIEILSFSRLAAKLVGNRSGVKYLDDTGRSMLLRKVISENSGRLGIFAPTAGKSEFAAMMGSLIQEFKQHKVSPDSLKKTVSENREKYPDRMLMKKLSDVAVIYEAYESELRGKYIDTEDYISRLCDEVSGSSLFEGSFVWVDGFDFFSKRLLSVLENIALKAVELNISLTYSEPGSRDYNLFAPVEASIREIKEIGVKAGIKVNRETIPESFRREQNSLIRYISENLYAFPPSSDDSPAEGIKILRCEDRETEVESAAAEIRRLVEKEGYRFRDIAVAVNDSEAREDLFDRIFSRAGIEFYRDGKVSGAWNRYMQFIMSICRGQGILGSNEDIFRLLYTGVLDISTDEAEILENYVFKYGIEGSLWKRDFYKIDTHGKTPEEAEAELKFVNSVREKLISAEESLQEYLKGCSTGREFAEGFFEFLRDCIHMDEMIVEDGDRLKTEGRLESAEITVQLWNRMTSMLGQIEAVLGDYECGKDGFFELLGTGIETMEISMIPTTIDQVYIGDYSSGGFERIKVLFAMGMNDGIVPSAGGGAGILSDFEKKKLNETAGEICSDARSRTEKEKLAIYKTLSAPTEKLILSCTFAGEEDDDEPIPSPLLNRIKKILPGIKDERIVSETSSSRGELIYRSRIEYMKANPEKHRNLKFVYEGKNFRNNHEFIGRENFLKLYGQVPELSPTSLEAFSRCPYAHFMRYGLRADERRVFEVSPSEMGTVFHETLMRFSREISERKLWNSVDEDLCEKMIGELAEAVAGEFRKGFLFEGSMGKYRISRVKSVCEKTAYMMANHVSCGSFDRFFFEIPFGTNCKMPAIEVETPGGGRVLIEGRIDRIDVSESVNGTLVKVIDYKSGADKVDKKEIVSGYKLQLMLYMKAALQGMNRMYTNAVPAGVFYFKIQEPSVDLGDGKKKKNISPEEQVESGLRKAFKMDGIVVNEPEIIDAFDKDFEGYSEIIRVQKRKDGFLKGTGDFAALNRDEFENLIGDIMKKTEALCDEFTKGSVEIRPMKISDDARACKYCKYKSICNFDVKLPGFEYSS
ncbi:MAG: PD-(D/E)XK nuclease family protein [Bacillota bacterium]|nr:PD-(D/E)XK nuclease family protein [Bacillota bacterium]